MADVIAPLVLEHPGTDLLLALAGVAEGQIALYSLTDRKAAWVRGFAQPPKPNVTRACQAAEVSRVTAYAWQADDPAFAAAWAAIWQGWKDSLEDVATQRATTTSDKLLEKLLNAHIPETYARPTEVHISSQAVVQHQIALPDLQQALRVLSSSGAFLLPAGDAVEGTYTVPGPQNGVQQGTGAAGEGTEDVPD